MGTRNLGDYRQEKDKKPKISKHKKPNKMTTSKTRKINNLSRGNNRSTLEWETDLDYKTVNPKSNISDYDLITWSKDSDICLPEGAIIAPYTTKKRVWSASRAQVKGLNKQ